MSSQRKCYEFTLTMRRALTGSPIHSYRFSETEETLGLARDDVSGSVEDVLAERLGDADAFVGVFTAETVENEVNALW